MELADLRKDYKKAALEIESMPGDPFVLFRNWMEQAQSAQLPEPNAMVLATVDPNGQPFTRTVLLKNLDERGLVFFTNFESRKSLQIAENAKVSALFLWLDLERQVSVNGTASRISSTESLAYFASRPLGSRLGAWASKQSSIIKSRSILEAKLEEMKRKFSSGQIPLPSFWGGFRIAPQSFEFWQGRQNRLHDRFIYERKTDLDEHSSQDSKWNLNRLSP